jgi:hypothetical protein
MPRDVDHDRAVTAVVAVLQEKRLPTLTPAAFIGDSGYGQIPSSSVPTSTPSRGSQPLDDAEATDFACDAHFGLLLPNIGCSITLVNAGVGGHAVDEDQVADPV